MDQNIKNLDKGISIVSKQTFLKELFNRRVPQIIGIYIATTWMMIEIGDWIVERFFLAAEITSYIFIGMITFTPSIILLAYQYGRPGPDKWKMTTFTLIPLNLFLAVAAMHYMVEPMVATETKVVVDERGVQQVFEVPKEEYHKEVAGFFWKNKSGKGELDWIRYGLPWMLSKDLDRSLFISSYTPFESKRILTKIQESGFSAAVEVPNSMKLSLARGVFSQYSLNGEFDFVNGSYFVNVDIVELKSGKVVANHQVSGVDLFTIVDELTHAIKNALGVHKSIDEISTDLPVAEHISESISAVNKYVLAKIKRHLDNDYFAAKALLDDAVELDFSFAYALTELARVHQLMGNGQEAELALRNALKHEYKFSSKNKFRYKGMAYELRGDYVSQVKVFDMWVELFPDDVDAHESLVRILSVTGLDHEKSLRSLERLRQLKPDDSSVYRIMAQTFLLQDKLDKSILSMEKYIAVNPEDIPALIQLADIYIRSSKFQKARDILEKAILLERNNLDASLKIVALDVRLGHFEDVEYRLAELLDLSETNEQKFTIYSSYFTYYSIRGQMKKVIESLDNMLLNSQHLPPIMKVFTIDFQKSLAIASLGTFEQAHRLLDIAEKQLQAPLNGVIDLGRIAVEGLSKNDESQKRSFERLEKWIKKYPNPIFSAVLESAKAQMDYRHENYELALESFLSAHKGMSGSLVRLQSEYEIFDLEIRIAKSKQKLGQLQEAEQILTQIKSKSPMIPLLNMALADLYLEQNNTEKLNHILADLQKVWASADKEYIEYQKYVKFKEQIERI